jgi:hypothetical protein
MTCNLMHVSTTTVLSSGIRGRLPCHEVSNLILYRILLYGYNDEILTTAASYSPLATCASGGL